MNDRNGRGEVGVDTLPEDLSDWELIDVTQNLAEAVRTNSLKHSKRELAYKVIQQLVLRFMVKRNKQ